MARTSGLSAGLPRQEPGTRPSNALKYELYAEGKLSGDGSSFTISFEAGKQLFGGESLGAPFNVYAPGNYYNKASKAFEPVKAWAFAVSAGDSLDYHWPLEAFEGEHYHLRIYGPNGFFREFYGNKAGPSVEVICQPIMEGKEILDDMNIEIKNSSRQEVKLKVRDYKYRKEETEVVLKAGSGQLFMLPAKSSRGWYDFTVQSLDADNLSIRYAGRLETGADRTSDPFMAGV
jgi:phospholipase C